MSYTIQCAAAPNRNQFRDLKERGFDAIEIHLMDLPRSSAQAMLRTYNLNTYSVHTPIMSKTETDLNAMLLPGMSERLTSTMKFAQELASYYKHQMYVIVHNTWHTYDYQCAPEVFSMIVRTLQDTFRECPDVRLCIENVPPFDANGRFANGSFLKDIRLLCDRINDALGAEFVGICFDACHFLSSVVFTRDAFLETNHGKVGWAVDAENLDLYANLEAAGELLWNIHVSTNVGLSDTSEKHAVPLSAKDVTLWKNILGVLNENKRKPLLTIEVTEANYGECVNAQVTKFYLEKAINGG